MAAQGVVELPRDHEVVLRALGKLPCRITLLSGSAEHFGVEMEINRPNEFHTDAPLSFFTWYGCTLRTEGFGQVVQRPAPHMVAVANLHAEMEKLRENAERKDAEGPRIMVVGEVDTGKSTLCRMLLAFAARVGRRPALVDLDAGQNSIAPAGTVAASVVDRHSLCVQSGLEHESPLMYSFGYSTPSKSMPAYLAAVDLVARGVDQRMARDKEVRHAGLVANTCGWVQGQGYHALLHAAGALRASYVFVMGNNADLERVLRRDLRGLRSVVKRVDAAAAVTRGREVRRELRALSVSRYFFGAPHAPLPLRPAVEQVQFASLRVYEWERDEAGAPVLAEVPLLSERLKGKLLAVVHAQEAQAVATANVAGFVAVLDLDPSARTVRLLCPREGPLPSKFAIVGSIEWAPSPQELAQVGEVVTRGAAGAAPR